MRNIIVANVGWSSAYDGHSINSSMGYVVKHGTGAEAYNFHPFEGLFYGYVRGASALAGKSDRLWTIVFVSKPDKRAKLRIVGWYEDATVGGYRTRPEYEKDGAFPDVRKGKKFLFCAVTAKAFIVPPTERDALILPRGHRIKSSGLYYVAGSPGSHDTDEQLADRDKMATWIREVLPSLRSKARLNVDEVVHAPLLPGITLDDGGTPTGRSAVGESDEHRSLREWARDNAEPFTGVVGPAGETEWSLPSGDRVDAVHLSERSVWLIEAKSRRSGLLDLERGVYQCIKYRAVTRAMPGHAGKIIHAILLTEGDLPAELRPLIDQHDIRHIQYWCGQEDPA